MTSKSYVVLAQWDEQDSVWYVKASDIPGLFVEAETLEEFREIVYDVAPELIKS
jgi:predicted RNase H-like HicB family nuclease